MVQVRFMPHGACWMWDVRLVALHAPADLVTFFAYCSIPLIAIWIYRHGRLKAMATAFPALWRWGAAFVLLCGISHLGNFAEVFYGGPLYWWTGVNKIAMAAVSVRFAVEFWRCRWAIVTLARALGAVAETPEDR